MLTKLIILGILNRRRHYGYEIKKTIEFELEDFDIKFGSIYHALKSFHQKGLINRVEIEQTQNGRPDRYVYEITKKGKIELDKLLRLSFQETKPKGQSIDAALHFLEPSSIDQVIPILKKRVSWLKIEKDELLKERNIRPDIALAHAKKSELKKPNKSEVQKWKNAQTIIPLLVENIYNHKISIVEAEIKWMAKLLRQLQDFVTQ